MFIVDLISKCVSTYNVVLYLMDQYGTCMLHVPHCVCCWAGGWPVGGALLSRAGCSQEAEEFQLVAQSYC